MKGSETLANLCGKIQFSVRNQSLNAENCKRLYEISASHPLEAQQSNAQCYYRYYQVTCDRGGTWRYLGQSELSSLVETAGYSVERIQGYTQVQQDMALLHPKYSTEDHGHHPCPECEEACNDIGHSC